MLKILVWDFVIDWRASKSRKKNPWLFIMNKDGWNFYWSEKHKARNMGRNLKNVYCEEKCLLS